MRINVVTAAKEQYALFLTCHPPAIFFSVPVELKVCIQMFKHICKQLTSSVVDSEVRSLRGNLVVRDVRVFICCSERPHMSPGWLLLEQIQSVERAVPRPGRGELRSEVVHINDRYN